MMSRFAEPTQGNHAPFPQGLGESMKERLISVVIPSEAKQSWTIWECGIRIAEGVF